MRVKLIPSLTYAAKKNAKWFKLSLSQNNVYEKDTISTFTYKTKTEASHQLEVNFLLFVTMVQKNQKSLQTIAFSSK